MSYTEEIGEALSVIEHLATEHQEVQLNDPGAAAHLLSWAASQLDAVKLATDLYERVRAPGGKAFLEYLDAEPHASEVMFVGTVVRGAMTVLDLCGAVLYLISTASGVTEGKEAGLSWWFEGDGNSQRDLLSRPLPDWLAGVRSPAEWDTLKHLRDDYTHRQVRRDAQASPSAIELKGDFGSTSGEDSQDRPAASNADEPGPPGVGPGRLHVGKGREERIDPRELNPKLLAYAEAQYRAFLRAIEASG